MKKIINTKSTRSKAKYKKNLKQNIFKHIKDSFILEKILRYAWWIHIPLLVLSILLVYNKISPINTFWNVIYYFIYYIIFLISIYSVGMLKNDKFKNLIVVVGISLHMLNILNFALFIPCVTYMFLFSKKLRLLKILAMFVPITIAIIIFSMYISVYNLTEKVEIKKAISPNGNYIARHITYNAGALGGNEIVMLERRYRLLFVKREKQIYIDSYGRNISIRFKDDKHLILNGREITLKR